MMLLKLLTEFRKYQMQSAVVSLLGDMALAPRLAALNVPVYSLNLVKTQPSPRAIWRSRKIALQHAPDVIQGWMYHGNFVASATSYLTGAHPPVVWNIRASLRNLGEVSRTTRALVRVSALLSHHPASIIYNSEVSTGQHEAVGYSRNRRLVIPNGFDCQLFRPSAEMRQQIRGELGVPEGVTLVGLVARYHPMKDHATFLKAAALVAKMHSDVRFVLVGSGLAYDNVALAGMVDEHRLRDRVYLLGRRTDIPQITTALDIACSSSAWGEGFSNSIGEAMACGVPCVVTDCGDSGRIVGETGILVPIADPNRFALAISSLIKIGSAGRRAFGAAARQRVKQEYSLQAVAAAYARLYQRVGAASRLPN